MTTRKQFEKRFQPIKFSFKSERNFEDLYLFYLQKLTSRAVKKNKKPRTILSPHQFAVSISFEVEETEKNEPKLFYASKGLQVDIYNFLIYVTNPLEDIKLQKLDEYDQSVYQKMFNGNCLAGLIHPSDVLLEVQKVKDNVRPETILNVRNIQAEKYAKMIKKMFTDLQTFLKEHQNLSFVVEDQTMYILPQNTFTLDDVKEIKLEDFNDVKSLNRIILGDLKVSVENKEDLEYLRELVDLYGENIVKNTNYVYADGAEVYNFTL